jgi:hypothetical protein
MITQLDKRLQEIHGQLHEREKLDLRLVGLQETLADLRRQAKIIRELVAKKEADVARLESGRMLDLLEGEPDFALKMSREELSVAFLRYEEALAGIAVTKFQIAEVEERVRVVAEMPALHRQLLNEKEAYLIAHHEPARDMLFDLVSEMADLKVSVQELEEVVNAGNLTLTALDDLYKTIRETDDATWGNENLATWVGMNRARPLAHQAQQCLRDFFRELHDVTSIPNSELRPSIHTFADFADFFFAGMMSDWFKKGERPSLARHQVTEMSRAVRETTEQLQTNLTAAKNDLTALQTARQELIESY